MNTKGIKTDHLIILDTSPYKSSDYADEGKIVLRNRDNFDAFNTRILIRIMN